MLVNLISVSGCLKDRIYDYNAGVEHGAKDIIWGVLSAVARHELQTVFISVFTRCRACQRAAGGHFQHQL